MKNVIVSLVALAGIASVASAQVAVEANGARLKFEVFNGTSWSNTAEVTAAGQTVQIRAVVSYTGTNTNVVALGALRYQPSISNVDNDGAGASQDQWGTFRNGGTQGSQVANSMLTAAEGASGAALASGYGRVVYGGISMQASTLNVASGFRHSANSAGAPNGTWIRFAGSSVTDWLPDTIPGTPSTAQSNGINRGMLANQLASVNATTGLTNTFWAGGTQNLVIFRQAITVSDLDIATRSAMTVSALIGSIERAGTTDDRRIMKWQTGTFDNGTFNTSVAIESASITFIPTPATAALLGLGGLVATRRRRA
jgi:hypothetical protein